MSGSIKSNSGTVKLLGPCSHPQGFRAIELMPSDYSNQLPRVLFHQCVICGDRSRVVVATPEERKRYAGVDTGAGDETVTYTHATYSNSWQETARFRWGTKYP